MTLCTCVESDVSAGMQLQELRELLALAGVPADIMAAAQDEDSYTQSGRLSIVKVARKVRRHHSYVRRVLDKAREVLAAA